ncbi:MAG: hypothetical protein AAF801_01600 [Pseudomonadota bacterium]
MRTPTRRQILIAGASLGAIAATVATALPAMRPEMGVIATLRRCVPDLDMHPAEIDAFAKDVVEQRAAASMKRAVNDVVLAHAPPKWMTPDRLEAAQRREEEEIITLFMRSTNHLDPARGAAPTHYNFLANPYSTGCSNPMPFWEE